MWSLSVADLPERQGRLRVDRRSTSRVNITAQPNTYSLAAQVVDDNLTEHGGEPAAPGRGEPGATARGHRIGQPDLGASRRPGHLPGHRDQQRQRYRARRRRARDAAAGAPVPVDDHAVRWQRVRSSSRSFRSRAPCSPSTVASNYRRRPRSGRESSTIQFIAQCIPDPGKGVFPDSGAGDRHARRHREHHQCRAAATSSLLSGVSFAGPASPRTW